MRFEKIVISRDFESNKIKAEVTFFENDLGIMELTLTQDQCQQIRAMCAERIINTAKKAADDMTTSVITPWDKHDKIKS